MDWLHFLLVHILLLLYFRNMSLDKLLAFFFVPHMCFSFFFLLFFTVIALKFIKCFPRQT